MLAQADEEIYKRLTSLVNGETFTTFIDTGVIYPQIKSNPSTIYSFLLVTGYLKALKTTPSFSGAFVTSNRESGDGRYDIQLKPTQKGLPGILIELKEEKNCSDEQLKKLSETALQQINDKKYETELTTAGVRTIYKYGVAFSGKKVEVAVE